jgi:hypothetical protein
MGHLLGKGYGRLDRPSLASFASGIGEHAWDSNDLSHNSYCDGAEGFGKSVILGNTQDVGNILQPNIVFVSKKHSQTEDKMTQRRNIK